MIDPWAKLADLANVFRHQGEAQRDDNLGDLAVALDALANPETRSKVVKFARRELKKLYVPLTAGAAADALRDEIESSRPSDVGNVATTARKLAVDVVTAVIKLPVLQQRMPGWPRFNDDTATHHAAIDRVAKAVEPLLLRGSDSERLTIAAMNALGDDKAEGLFARRK